MGIFDFLKKKNGNKSELELTNLTITQEMLIVLFDKNTIENVNKQWGKNNTITPINCRGMNFRLFNAEDGNVNLELLAQNEMGMYYKPIGFFEKTNDKLKVTILKEFEQDYENMRNNIKSSIPVNYLTLKENSFIAAASRDIIVVISKMFNDPKYNKFSPPSFENMQFENFISNGLSISVRTSMLGALETNLDDDNFELEDSLLVMYQNRDGISLHSTDNEFYDMQSKGLLSAFKGL
jgi:hypothetical protein